MLRIGIDVGGTFTDVVAIETQNRTVVARVKVPTTHQAEQGVAAGIVDGLQRLLQLPQIDPRQIAFIAHSTTQATNALLEGDVARVGVIGLLGRFDFLARSQIALAPLALAERAVLAPATRFVRAGDDAGAQSAIAELVAHGVEAIAVSQAFSVDRPQAERTVVALARERGLPATAGHEVASLYGLRARTRTAVLNAAILPTMVRTSQMTAGAVGAAGIAAPLMIMRSDGGVMDVREVARRPILTMLSGPAAGVAGALLHENVSDGIFIEVGGTSSDLSVIRHGLPQMRPARIGKHRTMLRTLDVRTIAVAGGSLPRFDPRAQGTPALREVGPRSAHIAGLRYASFTPAQLVASASVAFIRPQEHDPDDYLVLELADGTRAALTPTCAANLLGFVPADAFARGDIQSARIAFETVGRRFGTSPEVLAEAILTRCARRLHATIAEMIDDYALDVRSVELVGGGGGAAAIVPFAAKMLRFEHRIARDAEVISPIGVALALARDVVERNIVNPTPEQIVRVRREAFERVVASGASPELVDVVVEIDARRNLVRAVASGATAASANGAERDVGEPERRSAAARAAHVRAEEITHVAHVGSLDAYVARRRGATDAFVVDGAGVVRLIARDASLRSGLVDDLEKLLRRLLDETTSFGDVGRALPEIHLAYGRRVADLGALAEADQVIALASEELRGLEATTPVLVVASRRAA
ncbi:MAG TPA: hydantoinase/oxoprolinase family protein [Candidatus Acidoferrales bacterium]|nr:hydantoinase/oxoprolinase family protein [Candidatus Acidoferrales bacterium]